MHECTRLCTHTTHTYTHTHTHTLTQTGLVPLGETLGSYISHCIHKACKHVQEQTCTLLCKYHIRHKHTHTTHTHMCTHTCTCTHTDWACNACSDFGFLFLTLSLQSVHVHECTHLCTHTCTYTQRLGLYHLQSFYKAYMCMNEHIHTYAHTHSTT